MSSFRRILPMLMLMPVAFIVALAFAQGPGNPVARTSDMVTLREYVDLRFDQMQRAVDKAEATMNERLIGMNEFRDTLKDQTGTFITAKEANSLIEPLQKDVRELRSLSDQAKGKASQTSVLIAAGLALLSLALNAARWLRSSGKC